MQPIHMHICQDEGVSGSIFYAESRYDSNIIVREPPIKGNSQTILHSTLQALEFLAHDLFTRKLNCRQFLSVLVEAVGRLSRDVG